MKKIRQLMTVGLFALLSFLSLPAFSLAVEDAVKVTSVTNARSSPSTSGTINGEKPVGSVGTIKTGSGYSNPTYANGYTWWYVVWDTGSGPANGWSIENNLSLNTPTAKSFSNGSNIQLSGGTNRRAAASTTATYYETMPSGSTGVVGGGPNSANGYIWWYVTWSTGAQGWSVQDYMSSYTPASTITSVSVSCSPITVQVNQTSQCSASVSGTGSYSGSVNWSASAGSVNASGYFIAPNFTTTATVTATSVQNSSKAGLQNLAINTGNSSPAWTQPDANVFLDTTGTGWYIEQWSGVTNNPTSPYARTGQNSLQTTTTTQWGRVQLTAWAAYRFDTTGYQAISFWINPGTLENETIYVGLLNSGLSVIQYINLADVPGFGAFHTNEWKQVIIKLDSLGAASTNIYGVEFQSANPATWNIDEVKFNTSYGVCQ